MTWSLVGLQVDWMMNTSCPRTFSFILTDISPSLKRLSSTLDSSILRYRAISSASSGFDDPENTLSKLSPMPVYPVVLVLIVIFQPPQLLSGIYAASLHGILQEHCPHRESGAHDMLQRIGKIVFALGVIGVNALESLEQQALVEHIGPRVHFPDRASLPRPRPSLRRFSGNYRRRPSRSGRTLSGYPAPWSAPRP